MDLSPRTVLIPLAAGKADGGRVARVQADATPPAPNAAGLNGRIAELSDWGLYPAGAFALGAIQRLHLRPRGLSLAQRLMPGAMSSYLKITNGPDLLGLAPENSRSAELGLALALLMHAGQSRDRLVIATGALARDASPHLAAEDVAIEPVAGMGSKIEALVGGLRTHKGSAYASCVQFFLPCRTSEGDDTITAYASEFAGLRKSFAQHGVEIEIVPVASLRQAMSKVGVSTLQPTFADRLVARSIVGAFASLCVGGLGYLWLNAPLEVTFDKIELSDGTMAPSPLRAVYDPASSSFVMQPSCIGAQKLPVYRKGESLVLRASLRYSPTATVDKVLGYHYAIIGISERSGLKVYPAETIGRPSADMKNTSSTPTPPTTGPFELSVVLPVEGPTEKNKLIILARRFRAFDAAGLRSELETALDGKQPSDRINVAVSFLARYAPGYLDYSFLSAEDEVECEPR